MRHVYFVVGWILVGLGFIGTFLPVMPTTIFLILALPCFARSSPRFEQWLLDHRWFGSSLRKWRESGAINRRAKMLAISTLWPGIAVSCYLVPLVWVRLLLAVIAAAVSVYILSRPEE